MEIASFLEVSNNKYEVIRNISEAFSLIFETPPLVIIGSAISYMPPTSKPTGRLISEEIISLLIEKNESTINKKIEVPFKKAKNELRKDILFEQCFERAPNISKLREIINDFFSNAQPNQYHEILAKALCDGKVSGIITTNYDNCIDKCIKSINTNNITTIVNESDLLKINDTKQLYFKIHGTCDSIDGNSICLALSDETKLIGWKKELLFKMANKKSILFIAYSGLDFEICQELINIPGIKEVYWNVENHVGWEALNPNQINVLKKYDGKILLGDMYEIFHLMDNNLKSRLSSDQKQINIERENLKKRINDNIDTYQFRIWFISILTSMGYALLANRLSIKLSRDCIHNGRSYNELRYISDEQIAHSAYKYGKYWQANIFFFLSCLRKRKERFELLLVLLDFFENARAGYYLGIAFILMKICDWIINRTDLLISIDSTKKDFLQGRISGRKLNYLKTKGKLLYLFKGKKKQQIEKEHISKLEKNAKVATANSGDWIYHSSVQANANPEMLIYEQTIHSFIQSGVYFEAVYAFRKRILKKCTLSIIDTRNLEINKLKCFELGIYPEYWKLLWTQSKLLKMKTKWRRAIFKNQYSIWGYFLLTFFPEIFIT